MSAIRLSFFDVSDNSDLPTIKANHCRSVYIVTHLESHYQQTRHKGGDHETKRCCLNQFEAFEVSWYKIHNRQVSYLFQCRNPMSANNKQSVIRFGKIIQEAKTGWAKLAIRQFLDSHHSIKTLKQVEK